MTELDLTKALSDATEEVLSTMFFTAVEAAPDAVPDPLGTRVRVEFRGNLRGALVFNSSAELMADMAANFLGSDDASRLDQQAVAMELANMICGAVLSRLEGPQVFELGSPELLEAGDTAGGEAGSGCQVVEQAYGVGTGFLRLEISAGTLP